MPPRHARPTAPPIQDTAPLPTAAELLAENANLRNRIVELEARQAAPSGSHASGAEADPSGTLLHKAVDGFVLLDTEARILDANEAYCRMVGYTRGELLTMTVPNMEASETPEDIRRRIREIVETGGGRFEARHLRKDGEPVDLEVSVTFFPANGGRLSCLLRDITARKQAERALERRGHQFETVRAIGEEISRELNLARLLDLIVERAVGLVGATGGAIYLWTEAEGALVPQAWSQHGDWLSRHRVKLGQGLPGVAAARREGLIVNDYRTWPGASPLVLERSRIAAAIAEPLLCRERLVGVLALDSEEGGRHFSEDDRRALALFATQAAIAIENARLHAAAVWKSEELGALLRATRSVMGGLNLQHTLEVIASEAARIARCQHVKLLLVDREAQTIRIGVLRGLAAPDGFPLPIGAGLSGTVAATGRPLYIADTQNDPRSLLAPFDRALGLRTYLGLPIRIRDEVLGVLTFNTSEPRQYAADELAYYASFADQAALAIENARLHEAAARRSERLATLNTLNRTLTTTTDHEQVVRQILAALEVLIPGAVARLWLWDANRAEDFRLVASAGLRSPVGARQLLVRPTDGLVGLAVTTRQAVTSADVAADPRFLNRSWAEAEGLRSSAILPLICGDQVHGALAVSKRVPREFDKEEVELLWSFAAQAAIALQNARLFAELTSAYETVRQAQDELVRSEKLRALGQMAAGMAHDLNNILAAILGQTELLRLRAADVPVQDALNTLEVAATDAAEVVRRLQDFARQQPSRPLGPVDLAVVVREALEITRPRWRDDPHQRGITIRTRVALDDLPPVLGYAPELREALTNLILNAVDAMPQGGTLALSARLLPPSADPAADSRGPRDGAAASSPPSAADGSAGILELTVADTGVGMPEEVRRRVFDPFFTTKGVKGTGLGLSVVYGIVQRHGGRIDVASVPGAGTRFTLFLKIATGEAEPQPSSTGFRVRPRRVLVIDDDAAVRRTTAELLQEVGHSVVAAAGGSEGLAILSRNAVDLVITDLGMPGMTGWDVARAVRAVKPHPPVVLLTGWGERPASQSEHAGLVDRILGKPVRLHDLLAAIDDLAGTPGPGADPGATNPAPS